MRGPLLDRILASTALALVLGNIRPAFSQSVDPQEKSTVESRIPVPDTTVPSPPNAADAMSPMPANTGTVNATPAPAETQAATDASCTRESDCDADTSPGRRTGSRHRGRTGCSTRREPAAPSAATAPAAAPAAPTAAAPAAEPRRTEVDPAFAEKLRDLLTAKTASRYFARPAERAAAEALYKERKYAPVWTDGQKQNARGAAAIAYLQTVDADGMEPADYPAPSFKAGDIRRCWPFRLRVLSAAARSG